MHQALDGPLIVLTQPTVTTLVTTPATVRTPTAVRTGTTVTTATTVTAVTTGTALDCEQPLRMVMQARKARARKEIVRSEQKPRGSWGLQSCRA